MIYGIDVVGSLLGGILIGTSASLMLIFKGRVTGISGIVNGLFSFEANDYLWRWGFVLGLTTGGFVLASYDSSILQNNLQVSSLRVVIAGVLVGFGTLLGSGCTSGHGICGISRWSRRSLVATIVFMIAGICTVAISHFI